MANINIMSNSGHTAYGIKEFAVPTADKFSELPIDVPVGSAAIVIETGKVYMFNGDITREDKGWVEI